MSFKNLNNRKEYLKAMETFNKLMLHPLTIRVKDDEKQYYISLFKYKDKKKYFIPTLFDDGIYKKMTQLSPMFKTLEDCEQVIEDIGEANLVHMFKTLKGIYEDE